MRVHGGARSWSLAGLALVSAGVLSGCASAEADAEQQVQVILDSGERIDGTLVKSDLEHVWIRLPDTSRSQSITAILTYDRARIRHLEEVSAALPEYSQRIGDLADTPRAHLELAKWCADEDLLPQARVHALRSEQLHRDVDTETVLLRLGMTYADGAWQDENEFLARTGRVRFAGAIMSQEEAFRLQESASDNQAIRDTLTAISDDQVLLAAVKTERATQEARARLVRQQLAAVSDDILAAQTAIRKFQESAAPSRDRHDNPAQEQERLEAVDQAARMGQQAMPELLKLHAQLQRADALAPSDRQELDEREQMITAALRVAEARLTSLTEEARALARPASR